MFPQKSPSPPKRLFDPRIFVDTFLALMMSQRKFREYFISFSEKIKEFITSLFEGEALSWEGYFTLLEKSRNVENRDVIRSDIFCRIQEILVLRRYLADSLEENPLYWVCRKTGKGKFFSVISYEKKDYPKIQLYIRDIALAKALKVFLEEDSSDKIYLKKIWLDKKSGETFTKNVRIYKKNNFPKKEGISLTIIDTSEEKVEVFAVL